MKLTYRADIDGIRAIAVLAVIFYHADIKLFSGGFVGVDIFFVISGYLITTIILRELDEHEFSLVKFYERRIRRIFPALFTILVATLVASWLLFDAAQFKEYSQSLIATTLFSSNILFWTQSGYFEQPSTLKPLLHTWSLAVEEQFYIFFPLLLMLLARYLRPKLKLILLGAALISFVWNVYSLDQDPSGAFYLAHLRIWELLIGSLLAAKIITTKISPRIGNVLGLIGLGMLVVPVLVYTNNTPFPGFAALIPTLGAALIIYSGTEHKTLAGRVLSFWPIVFIGQISYSLYLWHWPLMVFAKYYSITGLTALETAAVLLVILILSALSWQFIEKPFRQRTLLRGRVLFPFAAVAMGTVIAFGLAIYLNDGFPSQSPSKTADANRIKAQLAKWERCHTLKTFSPSDLCKIGIATKTPSFVLWGDSHARAIAPALQISASRAGVTGVTAYMPGCPALLGIDRKGQPHLCNQFTIDVINYIRDNPNLDTIILAGRWAISAEGNRYKGEEGKSIVLVNMVKGSALANTNADLLKLGLERTVHALLEMGRKVVIVTQIPEIGYDVPSAFMVAQRAGRDLNKIIAPSVDDYIDRNKVASAIIASLAQNENVQIVEPWKRLCDQGSCQVVIKEQPLYSDDDHLSIFGAEYISDLFDTVFAQP